MFFVKVEVINNNLGFWEIIHILYLHNTKMQKHLVQLLLKI